MKKIVYGILLVVGFVLTFALNSVFAVPPNYSWHADDKADLGRDTRRWHDVYLGGTLFKNGGDGFNLAQHTFDASVTTGWTLTDREKNADVLQFNTGTTSSTLVTTISDGIPGKIYIVYNASVGTVTLKCENGTGTNVTTGKSYLCYTNNTPDIVKLTSD